MRAQTILAPSLSIEWGVASRPLAGEPVSGDLHAVVPTTGGHVVAAIDGLGHGREAAAAAEVAAETVAAHAEQSVTEIVRQCHTALHRTRGAAISMASFDVAGGLMTWIGVGNVDGMLLRAVPGASRPHEALLLRGGVVGYSLPPLRATTLAALPGDTLIFATDGVRSSFRQRGMMKGSASELAADLLCHYARDTDDALVLVVRYNGGTDAN